MKKEINRCFGNGIDQELYAQYHDTEWGIPVFDDQRLFEMLILEGAQAGLSWELILKRREGYRKAFYDFDPQKVALMEDVELELHCHNANIIRNRLKIWSARQNARVFLVIQKEFGSFSKYLWAFVLDKPIQGKEVRTTSLESDEISKDLKKRGMKFIGSTIIYAYMQAVGLVNDHQPTCWCFKKKGENDAT